MELPRLWPKRASPIQKEIQKLRELGLTDTQIAHVAKVVQSNIHYIANTPTADMSYQRAMRIINYRIALEDHLKAKKGGKPEATAGREAVEQ